MLGLWVGRNPDETLARLSVPAFKAVINPALKTAYATGRARFVDVTAATGGYRPFDETTVLEPYGRVVLLSGDVHYASGSLMSYWRGAARQPARFAQFTSSGLKNVMPPKVTFVDASLGLAQQLVRLGLGTERIGYDEMHDDLLVFPPGTSLEDLPPVMKSRLRKVPVALPSWGWPDLNDPAHPED